MPSGVFKPYAGVSTAVVVFTKTNQGGTDKVWFYDMKPDLIVLQSRSPSCGVKEIYDGTFSGKLIPGHGVFAEMALQAGFRVADVEDILMEL